MPAVAHIQNTAPAGKTLKIIIEEPSEFGMIVHFSLRLPSSKQNVSQFTLDYLTCVILQD